MVLDISEYRRLTADVPDFKLFLTAMPEADLDLERVTDLPRTVDLSDA